MFYKPFQYLPFPSPRGDSELHGAFHYFPSFFSEYRLTQLPIIYSIKHFPFMSSLVPFVQRITHIFPNFASPKFHALFFPFLGLSLDLMGKMKQRVHRPTWRPCSPVDLSSIGKQKLFLKKKKVSDLEVFLFKTTIRQKLLHT